MTNPFNETSETQSQQVQTENNDISALKTELESVKAALKSMKVEPKIQEPPISQDTRNAIIKRMNAIDAYTKLGKITRQQGAGLKQLILNQAFDTLKTTKTPEPQKNTIDAVFTEFEKSNPESFSGARQAVKDYITKGFDTVSQEELAKILELVKAIETAAIATKTSPDLQNLSAKCSNDEAKKRLASCALSGGKAHSAVGRAFCRADLNNMTSDEFLQYENEIMEQVKKGIFR